MVAWKSAGNVPGIVRVCRWLTLIVNRSGTKSQPNRYPLTAAGRCGTFTENVSGSGTSRTEKWGLMHRFFAALAVVTFFVSGIASLPSAAQVTGAVISGIVSDAQNAPIPNAQISVTSTATGEAFNTTTNGDGYYEF